MSSSVTVNFGNDPLKLSGTLDVGLDDIRVNNLAPITIGVSTIPTIPIQLGITSLPPIEIGITHLPPIDFNFRFVPIRVHLPLNFKLALCALGKELLSFETCGEAMVVAEDYERHRTERCA